MDYLRARIINEYSGENYLSYGGLTSDATLPYFNIPGSQVDSHGT